jgi:hypothetical protein
LFLLFFGFLLGFLLCDAFVFSCLLGFLFGDALVFSCLFGFLFGDALVFSCLFGFFISDAFSLSLLCVTLDLLFFLTDSKSFLLDLFPTLIFFDLGQLFRVEGQTTEQELILLVYHKETLHSGVDTPARRIKRLSINEGICARLIVIECQSVVANHPVELEIRFFVLFVLDRNNVGLGFLRLFAFFSAEVLNKVLKVVSRLEDLNSGSELLTFSHAVDP